MADPGVGEILGEHTDNPSETRGGDNVILSKHGEFQVPALEQRIKGQFERWLCGNAVKAIADAEKDFPEEANRMRRDYLSARSAGAYNWNGDVWRSAMNDIPGSHQLFYLLLKRCHPEMTEFLAMQIMKDKPKDAAQAVKWALGNEQAPESGAKKTLANGHVAVSGSSRS